MGYRLPDQRTIPTMTFDRPRLDSPQWSFASSRKGSPTPYHSSSVTLVGRGAPDRVYFPSHSNLDVSSTPYEAAKPGISDYNLGLEKEAPAQAPTTTKKGLHFWLIFVAINIATLLVAIDLSIVSTALPSIASDLNAEELYVWIGNAYVLGSSAVQPLFGQAANIFGRRSLTIASILLFMLGSVLAGSAQNTAWIIAARGLQGIGGGGIITLSEIIINDLLPLRERGPYTGSLSATYAIGTILGPLLGGVFTQHVSWRWTFYINLPICAVALAISVPFLKLKYNREGTIIDRLKRVDWIGNFVLIAAVTAILLALTWGGTKHPWGDWHITLPLYAGFLGLLLFIGIQVSGRVAEPTMPPRLFSNRTSVAIFIEAFFHGLILIYIVYYLPVYFQAVRLSSPTRSGVQIFPISTTIAPAAALSGILVTMYGRYRRYHYLGWGLMSLGCGLLSLLGPTSPTAAWAGYQALFGLGNGLVYNTMISPLLASLPASEIATASATWAFARSFGGIWGIAVPAAIFNSKVNTLVSIRLAGTNPGLAAELANGGAYQRAVATFVGGLPAAVQPTVIGIYTDALRTVWYTSLGFALVGIPLSALIKQYDLSRVLEETEFGLKDRQSSRGAENMG